MLFHPPSRKHPLLQEKDSSISAPATSEIPTPTAEQNLPIANLNETTDEIEMPKAAEIPEAPPLPGTQEQQKDVVEEALISMTQSPVENAEMKEQVQDPDGTPTPICGKKDAVEMDPKPDIEDEVEIDIETKENETSRRVTRSSPSTTTEGMPPPASSNKKQKTA